MPQTHFFTATLVQDSALSVSGFDRETSTYSLFANFSNVSLRALLPASQALHHAGTKPR